MIDPKRIAEIRERCNRSEVDCTFIDHAPRDIAYLLQVVEELYSVIKDVHSQRGDDVCWMDIDRIFHAAGLPTPDRSVGDKPAMLRNCQQFIDTMCSGGKWQSYADIKRENAEMRKALGDLLKSADCSWYERNGGHDWREAVDQASQLSKEAAEHQAAMDMGDDE